jgi:glutamate-1-semialdehyde 2,1-aminomutase/spore coat polysaccharide biosynthesis protein SpsF
MKVLKRELTKSEDYWSRAEKIIPAGTQTLSKGPTQFVRGVAPKYLKSGKGSHVWDVDGNEYIDYGIGCNSILLGYAYPQVNRAITKQLKDGINYTLMHPLEVELSELLIETIPCAEMVRFGKNGSDVTSAAIRVARAYTGRDKIVCCGYHGWQDWYVATTERNKGIPQAVKGLSFTFRYNNIESLEKVFSENKGEIAAVIMEPVGVHPPQNNFLKKVKEITHKNGAIFIFDEVLTGFRFSLGGAQEYFKVIPDLSCFGKTLANGMPVSAIVGKKEIMEKFNEVFFSFTFGGEALSLTAAMTTIKEMKERNVVAHLWKQGRKLQDGYNQLAKESGIERYTRCIGYPVRAIITFQDSEGKDSLEMKTLFQQEAIKRGILFTGYNGVSYSHKDEDIRKTLEVYKEAMGILKRAIEENNILKYLEGGLVHPVFRKV